MTDAPEPASVWWALHAPEVRKFWFLQITGWTIEAAVKAAYARAMADAEPGEVEGRVSDG